MNLNSLDFNILKHLHYLVQEKSVSNAAKKAGITQSAMSKSLKKIREIFEDEILIENGIGYSLSEKASHLKPKVEELLKSMDLLLSPCQSFDPKKEEAVIKIVSSDYGNLIYLPHIVEKLKQYPHIKLEVYSPQEQDLNRLQEEDVDFYLGIGKMTLLPPNLMVKKIFSEKLLSAVCSKHPLAKDSVTLEEFVAYPHMLISNLNLNTGQTSLIYNKGIVDFELEKLGLKRSVDLVVPHFSSAPLLLPNTKYVLSAPSKVIEYFSKMIKIKTFETPVLKNEQSEFYLAWHSLSLSKRHNLWFKEEIIDKIRV